MPSLASLARNGVPPGQRNDVLYRTACKRFRVHGTGPGGVAAVLAEMLAASDRTGFPDSELTGLVQYARGFIARRERSERVLWRMTPRWLGR